MEMKNELENIPYLSKTALNNYFAKNSNTLRNSISYWKQNKTLISLKRGFYVYRGFLEKSDNALYYPRFLATKMIEPSYLSLESVLQDYQMISDVVYNYSIISTKKTNTLKNEFGIFNYQSIKADLFEGYSIETYGDMQWYVASKAKALFDYMYFNQNKFSEISKKELQGLRLNLEQMEKKDWKEYEKYLKKTRDKMSAIYELMKEIYVD